MEISASHSLKLSYRSKCENLHGHNWIITVYCRSEVLNEDGMVVDFTHIKETVMGRLDHRNLNEVVSFNPTAENIARWVCEQIPTCFKVEVRESEGNTVIRFDIYLDEKKVQLKEDKTNPDIISYGFGEYRIIQDYPIRGRATYLHVRKRKWLDKSSNEIFSHDWDLSEFDGTRLNSEFVSFLKEGD